MNIPDGDFLQQGKVGRTRCEIVSIIFQKLAQREGHIHYHYKIVYSGMQILHFFKEGLRWTFNRIALRHRCRRHSGTTWNSGDLIINKHALSSGGHLPCTLTEPIDQGGWTLVGWGEGRRISPDGA